MAADLPIALHPGSGFTATFPADLVAPLTDDPQLPGGADPDVTDAMDEWPRMFGGTRVELEVLGEPIGRLEVQRVCDGQEIWGRGTADCQQKWQEYLRLFGGTGRSRPGSGRRRASRADRSGPATGSSAVWRDSALEPHETP